MSKTDHYYAIASSLKRMGWLQDMLLTNARRGVVNLLQSHQARSVVDLCCGAGALSSYLAAASMQVTGVDRSSAMLALARRRSPEVNWIESDVCQFRSGHRFDAAVLMLAMHEVAEGNRQQLWNKAVELVGADGLLVLVDYGPPARRNLFTRIAGFVIDRDEHALDRDDPGHYHNYLAFMEQGGIAGWMTCHGFSFEQQASFLFGHLHLLASRIDFSNTPIDRPANLA